MNKKFISKLAKSNIFLFIFVFIFFSSIFYRVFATPPSSTYFPSDTLDPTCSPGDSNCYISLLETRDEGSNLTYNTNVLDFVGAGVTATESGGVTTVTIPASSGATQYLDLLDTQASFSDKRVIFSTASALTDDSSFTYDSSTDSLTVGSVTTSTVIFDSGARLVATGNNVYFGQNTLDDYTIGGGNNTILGYDAAPSVSGSDNVVIGYEAGKLLTSGGQNVIFGRLAGDSVTTGGRNILIGYDVDTPTDSTSNWLNIGNVIFGNVNTATTKNIGINTTTIDATLTVKGSGNSSATKSLVIENSIGTDILTVRDDERIGIGALANSPSYLLDVATSTTTFISRFFNDGNTTNNQGVLVQSGLDDHTAGSTSTLIGFRDGDGTTVGSITFGSSLTSYNTSSDQRLKDNIEDTNLSIDELMKIKVRDFTWKADKENKITHGFIAQELYEIYPSAVTLPNTEDEYLMIDYSKLTPLVIKSIQDLKEEVEGLKGRGSVVSIVSNVFEGIFEATSAIFNKLVTKRIEVEEIQIKNDEHSYCIFIENGELIKKLGDCDLIDKEVEEENIPVVDITEDIEEETMEDLEDESVVEEEIIPEVAPEEEPVGIIEDESVPEDIVEEEILDSNIDDTNLENNNLETEVGV